MRNSLSNRISRLQIAKTNPVRDIREERICRLGFIMDVSNKFDGEKKHAGYVKSTRTKRIESALAFHPACHDWKRIPMKRNYDGSISGQYKNISITCSGYPNTPVNIYVSGGF